MTETQVERGRQLRLGALLAPAAQETAAAPLANPHAIRALITPRLIISTRWRAHNSPFQINPLPARLQISVQSQRHGRDEWHVDRA